MALSREKTANPAEGGHRPRGRKTTDRSSHGETSRRRRPLRRSTDYQMLGSRETQSTSPIAGNSPSEKEIHRQGLILEKAQPHVQDITPELTVLYQTHAQRDVSLFCLRQSKRAVFEAAMGVRKPTFERAILYKTHAQREVFLFCLRQSKRAGFKAVTKVRKRQSIRPERPRHSREIGKFKRFPPVNKAT